MSQIADNSSTITPKKEFEPSTWDRRGTSVSLRCLQRNFGQTRALDDLSIDIHPGELVVMLGPSGCGKTTALRALAGLEPLDGGSIFLDGKDVTRTSAHKRDMGMVFQAYSLFPNLTAEQNVAYGLKLRGVSKKEIETRVKEMLDLVRLPNQGTRYATELSGGQQQRVALARALAISPKVLLLDEPLSALDAKVRVELREEIRRIQLEFGITTLFVTHDQDEALAIADRIAVLNNGAIEQFDSPSQVYSSPKNAFVAQFVGSVNTFRRSLESTGEAVVLDQIVGLTEWNLPAASNFVRILARPESISLTPCEDGNVTVVSVGFMGSSLNVTAITQDGEVVRSSVSSQGSNELRPGVRARAQIIGPIVFADDDRDVVIHL